jgi:tetratricopeptide (TPR) repeat protein
MAEISLHEYCEQIGDKIQKGRYAEAVAHGRHILKQYPKHVTTYGLLGEAMLEAGQDEYAIDMFRRVLSADPENMIAWVGMSEVYNRRDELNATVWCVERAFELASDNKEVEKELRQLYGRRDGVEPKAAPLTPGALAHLYLKGDLLSRAISELRTLLAEHPERVDLRVALAEALWRNEQRLQASEVCQAILDELPYCLKANLILGEIWTSSGRGEGQTYLRRAEALDPENKMAQDLFGATSPLPAREAQIASLEYGLATEKELPVWAAEVEGAPAEAPLLTDAEAALVDITTALEAQIEIPSWLEEIAVGEEEEDVQAPVLPSPAIELPEEHPPENSSAVPFPAEEIPSWLTGPEEAIAEEPAPEAGAERGEPEWLTGLGLEPIDEEEEIGEVPDWLSELGIEIEETPATPSEEPKEAPEWMAGLGVEEASPETVPPAPPAEQPTDWLDSLRGQVAEGLSVPEDVSPVDTRILEMPEAEALIPTAEEAALPAWIEGEEMPSGDEALAWLEQLAAGKEAELRAQVEAESEARLAEIMGRPEPAGPAPAEVAPTGPTPAPAPAEIPDWIQELAPSEAAAPEAPPPVAEAVPTEAPPPPVGDAFGWTSFGEPEAPPEAALPAEEAALPAWIEGEEMPSGDEALAWLEQLAAGKEAELRAQVEAESEARLAEIMGRPEPAGPAPAEVAPTGPTPAPAPAEIPGWIQELAPSEAAAPEAPPPAAEAVPTEAPPPPVGDAFGWTSFGEPEAPPEAVLPAEKIASIPEEVAPLEAPAEVAPPVEEAPPVAEIPAMEEVLPTVEAPVAAEGVPGVAEAAKVEVLRPLEEAPAAEVAPLAPPPVEAPRDPFAAHRAYLKEHPRDYEARLAFARTLWQAHEREEALEAYSRVIRSGKLLENVIADLEQYLERWPDASIQRLLGDAHMKDGRLQEALDIYRQALETL